MSLSSHLLHPCRGKLRLAWSCALLILAASGTLGAQPPAVVAPAAPRIFLLTMGAGDAVWEKFGHNALWVSDPATGTDVAYNYGMFDFRQENFVLRFVQGRMLYWMEGFDALAMVRFYQSANRAVWAQELNLTPAQATALRDFLEWNARPENRFYRYDYYRDNCSTRLRDAIDRVLGGALRARTARVPSGTTYRWHTARLTADDPLTYTGLMMGLAQPADRPISRWEEMFLPMRLRDELRRLQVRDPAGRLVPLVRSERLLAPSVGREPERAAPPSRVPLYLLAGLALALVIALLAHAAERGRAGRFAFAAVSGLWAVLLGFGGLVLLGLWLFTDHAIAYRNENLFQIDPLALPLVVLLPALAYGARWAARPAVAISLAVAALSALGLLLKPFPGFYQVNGIVIALVLPANVALAWAALRLGRATACVQHQLS